MMTCALLSAEGRIASETRKVCVTMRGSTAGALRDNCAAGDDALSTMQKE